MEYNQKLRSRFLVGVIVVIIASLFVSAAVLVALGLKQNRYQSTMESAKHYFTMGDYQNAIVEYENAIAIDSKKVSAYLNLASVYINLGDYTSAISVIDRGLALISSEQLTGKKVEIQTLVSNASKAEVQAMTLEEIQEYSSETGLENNVFDMVAAYTYTEYYRDYGNVSAAREGSKTIVNYVNAGFKTVYYDLENKKMIDDSTNMPYAYVKPSEVSFDNLHRIFSSDGEKFVVSYSKLQELFGDTLKFHQEQQTGMYYISAEYKNCKIYVETDQTGNIVSENAWNKLEPLSHDGFEADEEVDGKVKGYVQDAMTGKGMKADMKVRERGKKNGTIIDELTSAKDGSYTFEGKQGKYTIEVSAKGYITEYLDVEIIRNQTKVGKNIVLSPEVAEGEIRIVLTWGSNPTDLDSYAYGKSSSGTNFNINYTNTIVRDVGNLDVDDTSSYGPETITITDTGASFEYSVVDFRAEGTMGSSGATVKVYLPGESTAKIFNIPSGTGLVWKVFKYENGNITKINQLTSDTDSGRFHIGGR